MKTKIRLLMTLLLMAVMGSAWAEDVTFLWNDYRGEGTSSTGSEYTMVKEDVSITGTKFYCNNNTSLSNEYGQFYANGKIIITPAEGVVITQIKVNTPDNTNGYQSGGSITATEGSVTKSSDNRYFTWTGRASSEFTLSNTKQIHWTTIVVTYTYVTPAFPITAQSNNESYGTVSLKGDVITGSPNSGCRYADPAYTVSPANSATVVQNGNKFKVTPSAETTVTINFEAIPMYTVTLGDDNSTLTETIGGAGVTLPTRDALDDDYIDFAGWSETNVSTETTTAPAIIPAGEYYPTANMTLYPVYTKREGGTDPTPFTVGSTGDYAIVSAPQNGKYYALPTNPTVTNGKITAQEITVSEKNDVKYVETTNASGFTWTIASAPNGSGYTLSDGSKYIYHSNGGYSGTNLAYGTSTDYTWVFTVDDDFVKMKGIGGTADRDRGMLFSGTTIGGYSLTNWDNSGYNKTMLLPIVEIGTAYYWSGLPAYEIVDFTTAGYKTYVTQNAIDWGRTTSLQEDVHGYTVTEFTKTSVTLVELSQNDVTIAETPLIIQGKAGKNSLVISNETGADYSNRNLLKRGYDKAESEADYMYVLQKSPQWSEDDPYNEYKFYRLRPNRWDQIGNRQAYLVLPESERDGQASTASLVIIHATDEEPLSEDAGVLDGINSIERNDVLNGEFYTISGQRVTAPKKGLYIVNGKKVLVK